MIGSGNRPWRSAGFISPCSQSRRITFSSPGVNGGISSAPPTVNVQIVLHMEGECQVGCAGRLAVSAGRRDGRSAPACPGGRRTDRRGDARRWPTSDSACRSIRRAQHERASHSAQGRSGCVDRSSGSSFLPTAARHWTIHPFASCGPYSRTGNPRRDRGYRTRRIDEPVASAGHCLSPATSCSDFGLSLRRARAIAAFCSLGDVFQALARQARTRSSSGVPRLISARDSAVMPAEVGDFPGRLESREEEGHGGRGGSAQDSQGPDRLGQ